MRGNPQHGGVRLAGVEEAMNIWLIVLLFAYGTVGLVLAGYVARAGHENKAARSIQVVVALLLWPIILPLSIGAVLADRANEHEKAKADFEKRREEIRGRINERQRMD